MRRVALILAIVGALGIFASPANAVERHEHDLETPGTTTTIAGGLSHNAPCTAFLNFHEGVHLDVLLGETFPHTVTPTFIGGEC
jgi:hypothetical protein